MKGTLVIVGYCKRCNLPLFENDVYRVIKDEGLLCQDCEKEINEKRLVD